MLNLDVSLVFIALLVWFLMTALNRIFFKPAGQIIEDREAKIESESRQIESMTEEIERVTLLLEKKLRDAKKESARIKEELIKKGEETKEQLLSKTKIESQKLLETKMKELDVQIISAQEKLTLEIGMFSNKLAEIFLN